MTPHYLSLGVASIPKLYNCSVFNKIAVVHHLLKFFWVVKIPKRYPWGIMNGIACPKHKKFSRSPSLTRSTPELLQQLLPLVGLVILQL